VSILINIKFYLRELKTVYTTGIAAVKSTTTKEKKEFYGNSSTKILIELKPP
jgi:hypothetical protein